MKKVFIVHGFEGSPNGGWRPWLMAELEKQNIYACALAMPSPANPVSEEWVDEISRHIERNANDGCYLVGHSLGVPAILRYLESVSARLVSGAVLVSGPSEKNSIRKIDNFFEKSFDFGKVRSNCKGFSVIQGDNDPYVPLDNGKFLSQKLDCELIVVANGGHLNGSAGWFELPQCLAALQKMMQ